MTLTFPSGVQLGEKYLRATGRVLDLRNPKSFTEKVQLAKLTWRSPRMVALADKVEAKTVVESLLGPEWVTPNLYVGATLPAVSERNWPAPYVIKCNNRSGGHHFVREGDPPPDWPTVDKFVADAMGRNYGVRLGEWVYSRIRPKVLVEPFIGRGAVPTDYKLYTFGGKVAFTSINWNRFEAEGLMRATFDRDWNRLPFVMNAYGDYEGDDVPKRPACYDEMIAGAEVLARGFPFARIDLYDIDGRPRFGEVTFYPQSGLFRMPLEYDLAVGALWPDGVPD
jgi:hypothetical protein